MPFVGVILRVIKNMFYLMRKSAHGDGISREFAHVARRHFPDLGGDAILLHQRLLREVELQRIVGRQRNAQATSQVFR